MAYPIYNQSIQALRGTRGVLQNLAAQRLEDKRLQAEDRLATRALELQQTQIGGAHKVNMARTLADRARQTKEDTYRGEQLTLAKNADTRAKAQSDMELDLSKPMTGEQILREQYGSMGIPPQEIEAKILSFRKGEAFTKNPEEQKIVARHMAGLLDSVTNKKNFMGWSENVNKSVDAYRVAAMRAQGKNPKSFEYFSQVGAIAKGLEGQDPNSEAVKVGQVNAGKYGYGLVPVMNRVKVGDDMNGPIYEERQGYVAMERDAAEYVNSLRPAYEMKAEITAKHPTLAKEPEMVAEYLDLRMNQGMSEREALIKIGILNEGAAPVKPVTPKKPERANLDKFNKGGGEIISYPLRTLKDVVGSGIKEATKSSRGLNPLRY